MVQDTDQKWCRYAELNHELILTMDVYYHYTIPANVYLSFPFQGLLEQYTQVFQEAQGEIKKSLNNLKPTLLFTRFFEGKC